MKKFLLIVTLLIPLFGFSKARIDSLLLLLNSTHSDSVRVDVFAQISQEYTDIENFKIATGIIHQALDLLVENNGNSKEYVWHLLALSNAYIVQQNDEPALEYARKAAQIAVSNGLTDVLPRAYLNMGSVFLNNKHYNEAREYFLKALDLAIDQNDNLFISYAYNNLAMVFRNQQEYEQALNYLYKALAIKQKIGAPGGTISTIGNIARVYRDIKLYDSALKKNQLALDISKKLGSPFYLGHTYRNLGELYYEMGLYKPAIEATDSAINIATRNGFAVIRGDAYKILSNIMFQQGNYKAAFEFQQLFTTLNDSLNKLRTVSRIEEMRKLYDNVKEARQIEKLKLKNEQQVKYFLITLSIFLLMAIGIVYLRNLRFRQTKNALDESEKKFEQLFNEIPDAVFITRYGGTNSGTIINVNPAAEHQTGYSKQELVNMNIVTDISIENQPEPVRIEREDQLMKDRKIEFTERKKRKDGSVIWTEVGIQKIRFSNEDLALSVSRDITDRKEAEENLLISEAKTRSLINAIPDIIFVFNKEGHFINFHSHSFDIFLMPPEEFLGKKAIDVLPPDVADVTMNNIEKVLSTGETQVFDYKLSVTGGVSYFEARMAKSNDNEVLVIVRDITERRKAVMEIMQREEKYRSIFTNSPVGIFTFNQQTDIIDCNANFVQIIGSSREKLIGLNMISQLKDKKLRAAILETLDKGISFYQDDYQSITADKITPVKVFLKAIYDAENNFIEGVGICEDITDQKIYEREILNAMEKAEQSDRMKSSFMATMSHELRTPLNAVIGFSEMMDPEMPYDQIEEYAQIISKSGKHLLTIIEDIFDITSIESGDVKPHIERVLLAGTLNDLHRICLSEKERIGKNHLTVLLTIPQEFSSLKISTDIQKFQKLFLHLLNNALKFTKEGTIEFGVTTNTSISKRLNLVFFVKDTGIGIQPQKQKIIFESFRQADETSTREYEGTGLGLSISKKLIELLGGNIWIESEVGVGSTFYFELPCLDSAFNILDLLKQQNQQKEKQVDDSVALVAEDDDTNFQLFDLLLRRKKISVIRAKDGVEAVDLFKKNPSINIVLMDINMPKMNGYEATREIKKIRAEVPVIAVTAYALSGDDTKAAEAGCDGYLPKPINNKIFYETIFKYL